jgi:hypothetical protein
MNSLDFFVDLPRFDEAKCAQVENKDLFFPMAAHKKKKDCTN